MSSSSSVAPTAAPAIPVTVLGGYLGAGKTTILNRVLSDADGAERIAVLVNDFGDVNIDAALVESRDDEVISLANGCICCSLADGLVAALDQVLSLEVPPDRLLVEASGVADPAAVAAHAMTPGFRLDAVVVAVDATAIDRLLRDKYVAQTVAVQLRSADILALTKVDLLGGVGSAEVADLVRRLGAEQPDAVVLPVEAGALPVRILFGHAGLSRPVQHDHGDDAGDRFVTASWQGGAVSSASLEALLVDRPEGLVRAKGLVRTETGWSEVQMVGPRAEVRAWDQGGVVAVGGSETVSAMVAIGIRALAPDLAAWLTRLDEP